ncbi:MAG: LEA type 2 family protein [Candidatus Thiodiazotropha endolucinida]
MGISTRHGAGRRELPMMPRYISLLICCLLIGLVQGCSSLQQVGQVVEGRKPTAQVEGIRLTGLDFDGVDLVFDVDVHNPNLFAIDLADFDYDLQLFEQSFLKGRQSAGVDLAAQTTSRIEVPLRLGFQQLLKSYHQLRNADQASYQLDMGLGFKMPVIGSLRLPVSFAGDFPVPKIPDFSIRSLSVKRLTLNEAEVLLQLGVENPNSFSLVLQQLDYNLKLNGAAIGKGLIRQPVDIAQGGNSVVSIPLTIDLAEAGKGLYSALLGLSGIRYELNGSILASGPRELLESFKIPLEKQGHIQLK